MSGELILIVDDEPNIIQLARLYLERDGFQVQGITDGISGLQAVECLQPALIVLDIMLPEIDGLEMCRQLRMKGNNVPTISADADRLAQVFSYLIDNTIKHTPAGGTIQVRAQEIGQFVQVSIADTGPGIPRGGPCAYFRTFLPDG